MAYPWVRILLVVAAVAGVGAIIAKIIKKLGMGAAVAAAAAQSDTQEYSSGSGGTATIFINGGAPASGNTMGKISVDGNSLPILYSEAPIEITIPTGRHHVVVEGGVYGDARIDRYIDFDVLDVWTVDMPGRNDTDVIRHQMIGYSEYRRALSDSNFHVTRKQL